MTQVTISLRFGPCGTQKPNDAGKLLKRLDIRSRVLHSARTMKDDILVPGCT